MNELLLAALLSGTTPPTCTMELRSLFDRAERANYLVARATADSLSDGDYYHNIGRSGFGRAPGYAGQRANRVFGQVFELEITSGHLAGHGQPASPRARRLVGGGLRVRTVGASSVASCR